LKFYDFVTFLFIILVATLTLSFQGCSSRTQVQLKTIKTECPVLKIKKDKEALKSFKTNYKVIRISGKIYVAIKKEKFLELIGNYKRVKEDLNYTYNSIDNFNSNVKKLSK